MDPTEVPEYKLGWEWAKEHGPLIAELFTGADAATPELRTRLFKEAGRMWPSQRDSLDNDLKQTAFVAGAIKAAIETIPLTREGSIAALEAGLEMGTIWVTEYAKSRLLEELKKKPTGWWRRKSGDARPLDIVNSLSVAWRRDWAKERGRPNPGSKWSVLIDTMGSRELYVLANLKHIEEQEHGDFSTYQAGSADASFEVISQVGFGNTHRYPGEIVG